MNGDNHNNNPYLYLAHGSKHPNTLDLTINYSAINRETTKIIDEENMSESIIISKKGLENFSKRCRDSSPLTRLQVFSLQNLSKKWCSL